MNKKFTSFIVAMLIANGLNAQVISDEVTLGTSNDVYYNLSDQLKTISNRNEWDISFDRRTQFSTGIRINDAAGIKIFEASNDLSKWEEINVADESTWTELFNSDRNWADGALDQASASYGWGNYNMANHYVYGAIVFVLKYTTGEYVKLKIDHLNAPDGIYDFTYSKLESNGVWSEDKKATVPHASSPNRIFTYYSFLNNEMVSPEPEQGKWDLKFTKYVTPLSAGTQTVMYPVTGLLQSDIVKVAETDASVNKPENESSYSYDINTIGYNWKSGSGNYTMLPINYFIKNTTNNVVYKLVFKSYEGGSSAKTTFEYENVTATLGTTDLEKTKFGIYTNPAQPKAFSIVYNSRETNASNVAIAVYSMNGQLVHQETYKPSSSFTNKTINLSQAPAGVYIVKLQSGDKVESKKIVLR